MHKYLKLLSAIIISHMAGAFGSIFTAPAISAWYVTLQKPALTPPNWLFAPVWLTLYTLMGIAVWLVWEKGTKKKEVRKAVYWFGAQLILNGAWSFLFFGLRSPSAGLVGIVPLWFLIAFTIYRFYKVDKNAAYLLVPYLLWVTVATYLNYMVFVLN